MSLLFADKLTSHGRLVLLSWYHCQPRTFNPAIKGPGRVLCNSNVSEQGLWLGDLTPSPLRVNLDLTNSVGAADAAYQDHASASHIITQRIDVTHPSPATMS